MRKSVFVFAVLATFTGGATAPVSHPAFAQPPTQQEPNQEMLEHWRRATVSLGKLEKKNGQDNYTTLGTAVIVATDPHHGCLLTAKHMVWMPDQDPKRNWQPTEIQMRLARGPNSPTPDLGVKVTLVENGRPIWRSLSDNSDLAVIPWGAISPAEASKLSDLHGVSPTDFATSEEDVFQGAPIIALGYPGVIGEAPLSFPLARSGIIAWTDPSDRLKAPFLIDANIVPGNSGGPVFHLRSGLNRFGGFSIGGGLALIGIVSQTSLQTLALAPPNDPSQVLAEMRVAGIGGIGIIEPVSKAATLVKQFCGP